ncbi:MAG: hypothetical protein ACAI25_05160 [Planctomycetota bacterium]
MFKKLELAALYQQAPSPEEQANLKTQLEKFGSSVIPAYYVVDPEKDEVLSGQTGASSQEEFLEFVNKGLAAFEARQKK